jgi:predicted RecA/RadA family phage recombinase
MPQAIYVERGETIDYTPGSAVAAGAVVVQGDFVGVAKTPIAANTPGALAVTAPPSAFASPPTPRATA